MKLHLPGLEARAPGLVVASIVTTFDSHNSPGEWVVSVFTPPLEKLSYRALRFLMILLVWV